MQLKTFDSILKINAVEWNSLVSDNNPLLSHEFLAALETENCVGKDYGWFPVFFTLFEDDKLQATCPCYIKTNSYGEFVFDMPWADFYKNNQTPYFPKLVCAIPYTPTTSERILHTKNINLKDTILTFETAIKEFCKNNQLSGAHILFNPIEESLLFEQQGWITRKSCQYHWENKNYIDFDDFLATLRSKKRKNISKERQNIQAQGLVLKTIHGDELSELEIEKAAYFYQKTFDEKWGTATLSLGFFKKIAEALGKKFMIVFAYKDEQIIACSMFFISNTTLYGRYWGCNSFYDNLHFEACYYQGIEYCIKNKLSFFEPGAQGEHKIPRGFLPTTTYSSHWLKDPQFFEIITNHVKNENQMMMEHCDELKKLSPFRND